MTEVAAKGQAADAERAQRLRELREVAAAEVKRIRDESERVRGQRLAP